MIELLNDLPELVYIVDPDTHELLYVNEIGKKTFKIEANCGKKCYEVFQNLDAPCPFCTTERLREDETYTWEYSNPVTKRHYLLKDRLTTFNGRKVRSEVAFDITEQAAERMALRNALESEQMILECARLLHQPRDPAQGVDEMLKVLGQSLHADRSYIFEFQHGHVNNTYEWCADHAQPQKENLRDVDPEALSRWVECFRRGECVIIHDLEEIRIVNPKEYAVLAPQNIHSLVAVPLDIGGEIRGFLGVDNPAVDRLRNIASLLQTLRYFLSATLRWMEDGIRLSELSYSDTLTGLHNRNRYLADLEELRSWNGPLGMVYMDLNGLKSLNDQFGHDRGDAALVACAQLLGTAFSTAQCYRIGGDEFVAVDTRKEQVEFHACVAALRESFRRDGRYSTSIGASWAQGPADPLTLMHQADAKMYEEKRRFYRDGGRDCRIAQETKPLLTADTNLENEYNMLMSAMHVSVSKHLLRDDFRLIWANNYFYDLIGYTDEELRLQFNDDVSALFAQAQHTFDSLRHAVFEAHKTGKSSCETRIRIPRQDGGHRWIHIVGIYTDERIEDTPVVYTVITDVTDLVQTRKELDVTFDNLPGFVFKASVGHNGKLKLLYGNEQLEDLFGYTPADGVNDLMRQNVAANAAAIARQSAKLRCGEPVCFEVEAANVYGGVTHYQACGGCVDREKDELIYLFICIDISEIIDQRTQMRELAYVDPVTGGRNRARFELDAGGAVATAQAGTYALASLDLQKFKVVNDLFGIEAGDRALRHVYRCIELRLKEGEYVCRLSADTFLLLMKAEPTAAMEKRLQIMAEDINRFNRNLKHKYLLQMTVGIYPIDNPDLSMTQLQDRANMARKQIKTISSLSLCTCQLYSHGDRMRLAQEKDVENRMADALRDGQFVVFYQPKRCLQTGEIGGAEALVRWQDPARGLVSPNDFIPLFETNGFIVQLDLYVFEQVCILLRHWLDRGFTPIPISVNMSRAHLSDEGFLRHYEHIRQKHNIPVNLLELEVTESLIFENPQLLSRVIDEIHRCGYTCSMDDFGSGYSSLNLLRQVRVDTLKLDRAFFSSERMEDEREAAVIISVVELAKRLKLTTVAEGVETEAQAEFLRRAGCDFYQGFLFSRPLPREEFERIAFRM